MGFWIGTVGMLKWKSWKNEFELLLQGVFSIENNLIGIRMFTFFPICNDQFDGFF